MKESDIRSKFTDTIKKNGGDVSNHEDVFTLGVPDSSYGWEGINGWVEHKYVKDWPKRATTMIKAGIKKEQVFWLEKRQRTGGYCYLLIGVGSEIFLFHADLVRELRDGMTKKEYYERALEVWKHRIEMEQLKSQLCG